MLSNIFCRFLSNNTNNSSQFMTSLQLYKHLLRQCEKLPSDACKHYKFAIKQSYKQHKSESDPERIKEIIAKSLHDAKWIVNKTNNITKAISMFAEKIEDYEILEHLGKGGFAHVYRARCRKTGLFVAIKMIDKALMASAGMIGRVRQEVTIHSRLKHPAVLELYTFFEDAHYVYLVLELAHNGELAKHFKLGTCGLSEKAAADIFRQVVSGVLYLHNHNIIHRDLSLNNLLLTKDLFVKIADFGLATQLNGPDEKHVTMCGTPNYISPEVASRELHGLPADVWGLGCMLYTLLVGSPPFHTQHVKTTLNKVINADYKIPSELSFEAQDILQKLLCKDPLRRITLKGIMEHPFLNNNAIGYQKHEMSRDSGFLTTLHSTQHSSRTKSDDVVNTDCLKYIRECNIVPHTSSMQRNSYNLFSSETNMSKESNLQDKHNLPNFNGNHNYIHSPATSAHTLENLKKQDICSNNLDQAKTSEQNKENIPKPNLNTNALNVPPLCAVRLPNISHKTRNAILKIEQNSVVVEFIKRKGKEREERVVEICKISKDGMKIIIYSVDKEKNANLDHSPLPDEVFSYHNLPQKHWKKYLYAARFVDLVKAKTPKITLYTNLAKCQLMENGTDIEMFFYNGEKVTFTSSEGLKIIDQYSRTHQNSSNDKNLQYLRDHFEECSSRMNKIQNVLSSIPEECFPLIVGKRPVQPSNSIVTSAMQQNIDKNYCTPPFSIGSFYRSNSGSVKTHSEYK